MKGMALGRVRENGTFSVCFPRAGVGVRSSSQFLHFVLNPATSPGSTGSSCPRGGCGVLGWLLRAPGTETGVQPAAALAMWKLWAPLPTCVPFLVPPLASALSSHPPHPEQRNPCPRLFPTSLLHLSVVFPSGLVWCFSEHRVVCSTQRPPCCMFSPSLGCQGVCAPFPTASGGAEALYTPQMHPNATSRGG